MNIFERREDYRSFPFEMRVGIFNRTVESLGSRLGEEGVILKMAGRKITQLHSTPNEEERSLTRIQLNLLIDFLGSLQRPEVDRAILDMGKAGLSLLDP